MFEVRGKQIMADDMSILLELKSQLALNGINLFHKFKKSSDNIQTTCCYHKDGQENKPSAGILTINKGDKKAGTYHCFTCGITAGIEEVISYCFGYDDSGDFGVEWLIKNFVMVEIEERRDLILNLERNVLKTPAQYIGDDELDSYRFYHDYMFQRKLTEEIIEKFDVGFDKNTNCITFPVRDIEGNTLFIARRSVITKFFHYPENSEKPVYGLYELPKEAKEVIVCESIFNALTCYAYGKPAVALLGLGSTKQYETLQKLPIRKYICALDPDEEGQRAAEKLKNRLQNKLVSKFIIPEGKDINDLSCEEFFALPEEY
jgi:hypothetical protein